MSASRASQVKQAIRGQMKARLMVAGPAGSGKTWTSLSIATVLADGQKFAVVDTEEESALTYADHFDFMHLAWAPPYDSQELAATIADLGRNFPVIVVDSLTHFWRGDGGILDKADGKFGGWKVARPAHEDMVKSILRNPAHMIVCVRSKMAHEQVKNEKTGKLEVNKLGLAPQQDGDLEYEMNVSIEINTEHQIDIGKTRCETLAGRTFQPGHATDLAALYGEWLKGGEPVADREVVEGFVSRMNAIVEPERRKACKQAFVQRIGRPEYLRVSQIDAAEELVTSFEAPPTPDGPGGGAPVPEPSSDEPTAETTAPEAPAGYAPEDEAPFDQVANARAKRAAALTPSKFHKIGAARGLKAEADRRALVYFVTTGRTESAGELTDEELVRLFLVLDDVIGDRSQPGYLRKVLDGVAEHRKANAS